MITLDPQRKSRAPFVHAAACFWLTLRGVGQQDSAAGVTVTKPGKEGGKVYSDYDWDGKSMAKSGERLKSVTAHAARVPFGARELYEAPNTRLRPPPLCYIHPPPPPPHPESTPTR